MKFKSVLVSQVSGSAGGATFARNQGGLYMRARSVPTNPASAFQVQVRNFLTQLSQAWSGTLTAAQRTLWSTYSTAVPLTSALGDARSVGGIGMYNRSNVPRLQAGLPQVNNAPTNYNLGGFISPVVSANATTSTLTVSFSGSDTWVSSTQAGMLVYASRPQSVGITFFKGPYRFAGLIRGSGTGVASPSVIAAPFALTAGQRVFYEIKVSQADGRLSSPFRGVSTAV